MSHCSPRCCHSTSRICTKSKAAKMADTHKDLIHNLFSVCSSRSSRSLPLSSHRSRLSVSPLFLSHSLSFSLLCVDTRTLSLSLDDPKKKRGEGEGSISLSVRVCVRPVYFLSDHPNNNSVKSDLSPRKNSNVKIVKNGAKIRFPVRPRRCQQTAGSMVALVG